jgi:hypothetical protein
MRYENQNPQVTYLLEKIEEQEKIIKELKEYCYLSDNAIEAAVDRLEVYNEQIREFERLPFYKKAFYKFTT